MPDLTISCAFATSLDTHEHIAPAERLGYHRASRHDERPRSTPISG